MPSFEVINRPLTHNGRLLTPGAKLTLHEADGAVLSAHGRVRAAPKPRKPPPRAKPGKTPIATE